MPHSVAGQGSLTTITSLSLLEGLRDAENTEAWQRFAARYRPMIVGFAVRLGLSETDAQDAVQDTLLAFSKGYLAGEYDRDKGRLRSWLFGIAWRKIRDIQRQQGREVVLADRSDGDGFLASLEAPDGLQDAWDAQWREAILNECLIEVAHHVDITTYEAFRLYVLEEWKPAEVAEHLGVTRNAVYLAKNRVINRMRDLQAKIEEIW